MPQPELHRLLAWLKSTQVPGTRDECRMAHHMPIPLLGDRVRMSGPKIKKVPLHGRRLHRQVRAGEQWEGWGWCLCSRSFTLLGFQPQIFRSSHMKNEKASWAMVWGVGKGSEGNLQAMPRFESRNGSSWAQLRAGHSLPC